MLTQFVMDVPDGAQSEEAQGFAGFSSSASVGRGACAAGGMMEIIRSAIDRTRRNWIFECAHVSLRRAVMKIFV